MEKETQEIRLNKFLSESGFCSRREADRLIEAGKVLVDGAVASMGMKIREGQQIEADGTLISGKDRPVVLLVNKPRGIVCTTSDRDRAENIVDFIGYPLRVYPVGRLDKDSEGLILMTNQGELVNRILKGRYGHEKEYLVSVDRENHRTVSEPDEEGSKDSRHGDEALHCGKNRGKVLPHYTDSGAEPADQEDV